MAMRNFTNKLWNIGRYMLMNLENSKKTIPIYSEKLEPKLADEDKKILEELSQLVKKTTDLIERYRFDLASEGLYQFVWHRLADEYIEYSKERIRTGDIIVLSVLHHLY